MITRGWKPCPLCGSNNVAANDVHESPAWKCYACGHMYNQKITQDYTAVILTREEAKELWAYRKTLALIKAVGKFWMNADEPLPTDIRNEILGAYKMLPIWMQFKGECMMGALRYSKKNCLMEEFLKSNIPFPYAACGLTIQRATEVAKKCFPKIPLQDILLITPNSIEQVIGKNFLACCTKGSLPLCDVREAIIRRIESRGCIYCSDYQRPPLKAVH